MIPSFMKGSKARAIKSTRKNKQKGVQPQPLSKSPEKPPETVFQGPNTQEILASVEATVQSPPDSPVLKIVEDSPVLNFPVLNPPVLKIAEIRNLIVSTNSSQQSHPDDDLPLNKIQPLSEIFSESQAIKSQERKSQELWDAVKKKKAVGPGRKPEKKTGRKPGPKPGLKSGSDVAPKPGGKKRGRPAGSVNKRAPKKLKTPFKSADQGKPKARKGTTNKRPVEHSQPTKSTKTRREATDDLRDYAFNGDYWETELLSDQGTWVQCNDCHKWRLLKDVQDPSVLPARWSCEDNKDPKYSSCEMAEQNYDDNEYYISNIQYVPGSLVWYKEPNYKFPWPAMIDMDPERLEFIEASYDDTMYNLTYLPSSKGVSSISGMTGCGRPLAKWVGQSTIKPFQGASDGSEYSRMVANESPGVIKKWSYTFNLAVDISKITDMKKRIEDYGFMAQFMAYSCNTVMSPTNQKPANEPVPTSDDILDMLQNNDSSDSSVPSEIWENTDQIYTKASDPTQELPNLPKLPESQSSTQNSANAMEFQVVNRKLI